MLVLKLWNYMRGYVTIRVQGLTLERFINMCMIGDIYLWDVKRIDNTTLEAKIGIKGFEELGEIIKKLGCKVSMCKKCGYPFWIHRLKKRKMLLIGAFFCFLLLVFVSTFIFSIEIVGNENVKKSEIMSKLNTLGLRPGANRYFINLRKLENQLLLEINQLAWVGVEIEGVRAKVEVAEKIIPPDKIDKNIPCDIVAKKSGVIEKIIAKNGYTVVEEGDIVKEGEILISGIVGLEYIESNMLVHSCGEVYAKTYYESTESKSLAEIKKEKTGQKFVKKIFKVGSVEITFNRNEIPYDSYVVEKKIKRPLQWREIGFPVELIIEEYYEANEIEITIDETEAKNYIHRNALDNILEEIPFEAEILNTQIDFTIKDGVLYGKVIIEALENIAVKKTLQIGED
ncbi:MAG TPA: sporulation protein YqfD [Oscillospiraceae bacterium]|nr:sporulation protein YqfD [Oscillospiraceae bacterium]